MTFCWFPPLRVATGRSMEPLWTPTLSAHDVISARSSFFRMTPRLVLHRPSLGRAIFSRIESEGMQPRSRRCAGTSATPSSIARLGVSCGVSTSPMRILPLLRGRTPKRTSGRTLYTRAHQAGHSQNLTRPGRKGEALKLLRLELFDDAGRLTAPLVSFH